MNSKDLLMFNRVLERIAGALERQNELLEQAHEIGERIELIQREPFDDEIPF